MEEMCVYMNDESKDFILCLKKEGYCINFFCSEEEDVFWGFSHRGKVL